MHEQFHPTAKMSASMLDGLVMFVGLRATQGEMVSWLERQVLAMPATEKLAYMHVVLASSETSPLINDPVRQAMMHFVRACQPRFEAAAIIVPHSGFVGAAVRSVFSAILMATRPITPIKMFGSTSEAVAWLRQTTPCRLPDAARLAAHVDALAEQMRIVRD
ncbi:MAG: hypothetical protein EOO75_12825 [Myxococcales bacterium]|nr:MAG: hypothetical protein EOO75_12825 [Myxococcales bacterium]